MKFRILLLTIALFTSSVTAFAKPVIDSIGVKNEDGKKVIFFKVKAKDTYYSIGHRYNVKPDVIMKFNGSKKPILSIGAVVKVPTDQPYKKSGKSKETEKQQRKQKPKKKNGWIKKQRKNLKRKLKQRKSINTLNKRKSRYKIL